MRKTVMAIVAVVLGTLTAHAQQQPLLLSDTHAMVRTTPTGGRLLLLPVEEKEENAHVRVVKDNQLVKTLNVRLAVDRVDYLVPLQLDGASLLDIQFNAGRRQTGAIKDYVCWREMKQADIFDTANRERFRPLYHHTPQYGWMNDPNGMFFKDGVWHLYYQYNPYGSQWENMTWGHSTTRDLVHWEAQPLAIEPDALGAIFSGSCVVNKDEVVAMYTSAGAAQTQSMAVSKDGGLTFEKLSGNPVLTANAPDFRDPKMFWNEDIKKWNLVLAVGQEMQIFTSSDLRQWHYESSFGKELGCHDGVWECPDLFKLPCGQTYKWVLICNINPGGPFGGSATQYFVGDFDGRKFTCEHKDTRWMDYGKDHYATVTFDNAPEGRRVALAWMSNWQYANQVPTKQFRSANSVPRDLGLFEHNGQTYVSVKPSKELLSLRSDKPVKKLTEAAEVVVDVKGTSTVTLSNQQGEQVVVTYNEQQQTLSVDRTKSGDTSFSEHFAAVTTAPTYGHIRQLRLFIDRCSVEVFDADGKAVLTNLVFPTAPYTDIKATNKAKVTIYEIK